MHILQISNFYPPYWVGGYELIAEWVGGGLRGRGHDVRVLTGRGSAWSGREEILPELDLDLSQLRDDYFSGGLSRRVGLATRLSWHVFSPRNFAACRRLLRRLRPDLVSFWNPAYVSYSPLLACRLEGVPAVVHLSDTAANPFRNPHPPFAGRLARGLGRVLVDFALRLARPSRFIVPSAFLRGKFAREGLRERDVEVMPWPVEPTVSARQPPVRGARAERFLFVGALIPDKGPDVLLDAFREARAGRPEISLTFVGGGPESYVARLKDAARGLPVRFTGRLERPQVTAAYEEHDVLVFPSIWDEPYAVVPPEAMAMGLTVIGTTAGGTPEAIRDGETGLLVPPGDVAHLSEAMRRLAADPGLARRLGDAGLAWARGSHSFDRFLARLERSYANVASSEEQP